MEHGGGLDAMGVAWRLGATLFFVILNGFFVAAEFALVKVRSARIHELARDGNRSAKLVHHILESLDLYLSACQLGITLASLALGALGEPAVSRLIIAGVRAMGFAPAEGAAWVPIVSITLAFAVITILHMTLGEQAPKMWALRRSESTAMASAMTLRIFTWMFRPFIALINSISNWMLRIVGLTAGDHAMDSVPTVEELRGILLLSAREGHIGDTELEITQNVLRLTELEVRHMMVPRVDVEYLSLDDPLEESLQRIRNSSHSRFPVCERNLDSLVGIIHGKDVLEKLIAGESVELRSLAREPLYVPDTMALSELLLQMQGHRVHLAAVIDEHGTLTGLGFREDALEEIVGPLGDEFDEEPPDFREISEGVWEVRGKMAFPDLCGRLEVSADDEGEETVGGWFVATLGRLPRQGDSTTLGEHFRVTAQEVSTKKVLELRIERLEDPESGEVAKDRADTKGREDGGDEKNHGVSRDD